MFSFRAGFSVKNFTLPLSPMQAHLSSLFLPLSLSFSLSLSLSLSFTFSLRLPLPLLVSLSPFLVVTLLTSAHICDRSFWSRGRHRYPGHRRPPRGLAYSHQKHEAGWRCRPGAGNNPRASLKWENKIPLFRSSNHHLYHRSLVTEHSVNRLILNTVFLQIFGVVLFSVVNRFTEIYIKKKKKRNT